MPSFNLGLASVLDGCELRYRRWLSTPSFVSDDLGNRDQLTFAVGPRTSFRVGESIVMRPGFRLRCRWTTR